MLKYGIYIDLSCPKLLISLQYNVTIELSDFIAIVKNIRKLSYVLL